MVKSLRMIFFILFYFFFHFTCFLLDFFLFYLIFLLFLTVSFLFVCVCESVCVCVYLLFLLSGQRLSSTYKLWIVEKKKKKTEPRRRERFIRLYTMFHSGKSWNVQYIFVEVWYGYGFDSIWTEWKEQRIKIIIKRMREENKNEDFTIWKPVNICVVYTHIN